MEAAVLTIPPPTDCQEAIYFARPGHLEHITEDKHKEKNGRKFATFFLQDDGAYPSTYAKCILELSLDEL